MLYLIASQYLAAGHQVSAIVETTPGGNRWQALPYFAGMLASPGYLRKGLALIAELKRAGIPHYRGATGLRAEGATSIEALGFTAGGEARRLPCAALLLHNGVVPNVQITRPLSRINHQGA